MTTTRKTQSKKKTNIKLNSANKEIPPLPKEPNILFGDLKLTKKQFNNLTLDELKNMTSFDLMKYSKTGVKSFSKGYIQKKYEKIKDYRLDDKTKQFYPLAHGGVLNPVSNFKKVKHALKKSKMFLIQMEMITGDHKIFYVYPKGDKFSIGKKTYYIDDEYKYFIRELNVFCLDYHEKISVPIERRINTTEILREINQKGVKGISEVDMALNPKSLEQFIKSEVIQKVMQGAELDKFFRLIKLLLIINTLISISHFVLFLQINGFLDRIGG